MAATGIELIEPDWPAPGSVRAASSTRSGGCSDGPFASLNVGTHVGDDPRRVERNRNALGKVLGLGRQPCWLDQVHGARVVDGDTFTGSVAADAVIASVQTPCAIMTADCLPVLFADRAGRHVAAAHGGWRGLAAGVLENTVGAFAARGIAGAELLAWLGPAIGPAAYEVDASVVRELRADDQAALASTEDPDHWRLDLYGLARLRLAACGVDAVFGGNFCTLSDPERFFSYRRDGVCGRHATLIWIE